MNKEVKEHINNLIKNFNEMNYESQQEELFELYKTGEVDYVDVVDKYSKLVKKIIKIKNIVKNRCNEDKELFEEYYEFKFILDFEEELLGILEED